MKLLVCDVEGTIFQPHKIKNAQHASYIWTAIAEVLGKKAILEEISTQKKWETGGYGPKQDGQAYTRWVEESIRIHEKYGLDENTFADLIDTAPYVDGVKDFFSRLSRNQYIPLLISGGIQNLNDKACHDLNIDLDDSYAACKYYFDTDGKIDKSLTFLNTSNFYGKHELVNIALRKYGLSDKEWIFIGDGINDVGVAKSAPISIGISPIDELRKVVTYSYDSFTHMMADNKVMAEIGFFEEKVPASFRNRQSGSVLETARTKMNKQVANLNLEALEESALERLTRSWGRVYLKEKRKFTGIKKLLEQGELSFALTSTAMKPNPIVSAILQPFSNAAEIMIYVCLALTDNPSELEKLKQTNKKIFGLREQQERIKNIDLQAVIEEYLNNRNISAHSFQEISIDAGQTYIRRTYEIIQRLELIINPFVDPKSSYKLGYTGRTVPSAGG